ncbi:MAG TPA: metallophosphoesterase [Thermomicrobiales bacterium]|nr:metallophosphoesterase [Thermomicrobiales bacterium]
MSRRAFVNGGMLGGLAAIGLTGWEIYQSRYVHPYRPRLETVSIPLPDGAEGLDGMRIAFIADTHVGPFISQDDLTRALNLVRKESPDLVLFGGDYISESPRYVADTARNLGSLLEVAPLGGVAVLGNHDLTVSATRVVDELAAVGIPVLRNGVTVVTYRGTDLAIAGIDETLLGDPDPQATLAQVPNGVPALALWHEPEFAEQAAAFGAFAQLSGHTHGGQIRIPGMGPVGLPIHGKRHVIGLEEADGMPIYTTRGVGVYRPPARFNCPPEVTIVTLTATSRTN